MAPLFIVSPLCAASVCGFAGGVCCAHADPAPIANTTVPIIIACFMNRPPLIAIKEVARKVPFPSAHPKNAEDADDGEEDGEDRGAEQDERDDEVIALFPSQRVEDRRHGVTAEEAA